MSADPSSGRKRYGALIDLDAEREVLGTVFVRPEVVGELGLSTGDFYAERHALMWAAMQDVVANGMEIDLGSVAHALRVAGTFEKVGGFQTLSGTLDRWGMSANVKAYAHIIREKALDRRMLDTQEQLGLAIARQDQDAFAQHMDVIATLNRDRSELNDVPRLSLRSMHESGHDDWLTEAPPPADSLLTWGDGMAQQLLMPAGCVSLLGAAGGTGKSWLLVALAVSIATGVPWLGTYQVPKKGRVLLALGEEDPGEMRRRIWAVVRAVLGEPKDDNAHEYAEAARNIVPVPLMGQDVSMLGKDGYPTAFHRTLAAELAKVEYRAALIDPLSRFGGSEIETDAFMATRCVQLLEQLTMGPGRPGIVVAHHTNKTTLGDDEEPTQALIRGHSAIVDGPRCVLFMAGLQRGKRRKGRARLYVVKGNRGPKPEPLDLMREKGGVLRPMQEHEVEAEREQELQTFNASGGARKKKQVHETAAQRIGANTL